MEQSGVDPAGAEGGRLRGRIALVTGGTSGIGFAIAARYAREGARVSLIGRRADVLAATLDALGGGVTGIVGDVTRDGDLGRWMADARERFGRIDNVTCSAGTADPGPLATCSPEAFDSLMALNLRSPFFTVQKALPLMSAGGSITLIGSVAGRITLGPSSAYGASKAALLSFARNWALELAPRKIRVNVLAPGITATPLVERLRGTASAAAHFDEMITRRIPMGRIGEADEIARAAVFLACEDASYVTGGALYVDGGMGQM